jgi:hypothetical protein
MTETIANTYDAVLPALPCSSRVDFYVSVDEDATGTHFDPDTTQPFSAIAAVAMITSFQDDFQTNQGWTVSGNALDGQWNRGVPVGGGDRGDPPTDYDGSGQCYLTDNVDGNSDVDGGTTSLTSPQFDASGGIARINYARWYSNNAGDAPFSDTFKVFISNNDGGSWTLIEKVGPVNQASGGWFEHSFWVSEFVTPTNQMRLRFDASDLGSGSVVEAGVDAVEVTVFQCGPAAPEITTTSLPDWTATQPYAQLLQAINGDGQLTWTDAFGDLIGSGLVLNADGNLSGVPLAQGIITFTARVEDESAQFDEHLLNVTVNDTVQIATANVPDWTAGEAYSFQLQSTGGTGVRTWTDMNNDLAGTGLTISAAGSLNGTPLFAALIDFTAQVTDDVGNEESKLLSLTINPPVAILTDSLPEATEGEPYSFQITAVNGTGPLSWNDFFGDLTGTGLSLSTTGLLSGTPLDTGTISFMPRAADSTGSADQKYLDLVIVLPFICGDVDGSDEEPNVADLTYLVAFLFQSGPVPPVEAAANVDGLVGPGGLIDVGDLTYLVAYLFQDGPAPVC